MRELRVFLRRRSAVIGAVLVALNVLVALGAPLIARVDPQMLDVKSRLARPTGEHWFGTDHVGRDAWSRVIYGARLSMVVGGSVMVEFGVEKPGDLILVDHSIFRAFNKGALGMLHVSGEDNSKVFAAIKGLGGAAE